jgi:hypothetical protein
MLGRRPWKVDCADDSAASDVAVVVASLFGHVDGMEQTVGDPGVGDASASAAPRSRFGNLTREQWEAEFSGVGRGFFRTKAQRLGANGSDACGCRNPFGGVVVAILSALRLRVKTLDLHGLDGGGAVRRYPLEGVVVEPRFHSVVSMFSVASFGFPCFFFLLIFDLLYKRFSSPPCIGSAVVALFIKKGESLFRERFVKQICLDKF